MADLGFLSDDVVNTAWLVVQDYTLLVCWNPLLMYFGNDLRSLGPMGWSGR